MPETPNTKTVTLEFHPASDPPEPDTPVLCTDGHEVFCGWFTGWESEEDGGIWYHDLLEEPSDVIAWAHLPEPEYCLIV